MRLATCLVAASAAASLIPGAAHAQNGDMEALRAEIAAARAQLLEQKRMIQSQEEKLRALELRVTTPASNASTAPTTGVSPRGDVATAPAAGGGIRSASVEQVGEAPADADRPPEVAALGMEGSVVTRKGQLTAEIQTEYARADRNRALFRGVEVVESVLIGVFDINESRQDILTGAGALRYGLFNNLELGVRVPYVYRSDHSVLAPIMGSTANDSAATIDNSAKGNGIGDVELTARYQIASARGAMPFLIGNLQVTAPTGTDAFEVRRNSSGEALEAATGSGFWGVSPSLTAILPSDPAVLFGTIGYTKNFGHAVDTEIPPVKVVYVKPGDAISFSGGVGVSLNQRTSFNLGYAHSWAFGTRTRTQLLTSSATWTAEQTSKSRDLQIGRLLFGVTYRLSDKASVNWALEAGVTSDAPDVRAVMRIPLLLIAGR